MVYSLALFKYLKLVVRTALKFWSHYTSLIVSLDLHLFHIRLLFDGLAAGDLHRIGVSRCGRHFNRRLHVLVSLPQEDWFRKASSVFPIYAADLAEFS